jgi:serine phosphatase RsbU (regulator of sigma subunit)
MILDAMGHDLTAGLTTSVAMAAARNARRSGADLADVVGSVDQALAQWLPDSLCTGVLCRLDTETGVLRWVNCGHPHRF